MTAPEEQFEIFDAAGVKVGQAARSRVHREGLWHRSAHVFLFDGAGDLIIQRRVADKDVCGGLWDQSVGEHLKPGETYLDAAHRGLEEELGVRGITLSELGDPHSTRLDLPEQAIHDWELQQAFRGIHDGPVHPDPIEVDQIRRVTLADLARWTRDEPEAFTPWFLEELARCAILPT